MAAWTKSETDALMAFYIDHINKPWPAGGLREFAKSVGRAHTNVCRKARELGLTNPYEHPRGMSGKMHSQETKAVISEASRRAWRDPTTGHHSESRSQKLSDASLRRVLSGDIKPGYSRGKGGSRPDLEGRYFRSRWEANYARYLNILVQSNMIARWEYEAKVFEFHSIKRGTRTYTPDFRVDLPNGSVEWHEVKGWMDPKSKTKLARMRKFYPKEKVVVIGKAWFNSARKSGLAASIPEWEHGFM